MRERRIVGTIVTTLAAALVGVGPAAANGAVAGFATSGAAPDRSVIKPLAGTGAPATRYSADRGRSSTSVSATDVNGRVLRDRTLDGRWTLPAVTLRGEPGGLSADGGTLVLSRLQGLRATNTGYRFLDTRTLRTRDEVTLDGRFVFDAISPDGRLVYLVEYPDPNNFVEYRVRVYDRAAGKLRPGAVVDPDEAGEPMTGEPVSRAVSTGGRWAYTLYRGEETFVHALDTEEATAVCIDLPQFEKAGLNALDLTVDPGSGGITVLEKGDPAAVIDPETFEVGSPSEPRAATTSGGGSDWVVWAMIGAGLVLCAGVFAVQRRWLRRDSAVESELEQALKDADPPEREEPRPREPVA